MTGLQNNNTNLIEIQQPDALAVFSEPGKLDPLIEQIAKAREAEEKKREQDRQRRAVVHNEALQDLIAIGIDAEAGKKIVSAIVKGQIRNVSIRY